jgi:transposase-like protein
MELRVFYSLIKEYVDKANKHMEKSTELVAKFKCPLCNKEF